MALSGLKALARTRSLSFTRDYLVKETSAPSAPVATVDWWNGDGRVFFYRPGTSDVSFMYDYLFKGGRKSEYWLPPELAPKMIFDIGGHIGIVARYLAHHFPDATIHSFEPIAGNYELFRRNTEGSSKITLHPHGLGMRAATLEFRLPPTQREYHGCYSMARTASADDIRVQAEVRGVRETLAELGSPKIDLIKIDVEGAEHEIIEAFPDEVLAATTWIYGELHAELMDPRLAFGVLERLAKWFDIEVHKGLRKRNWFFDACNREAAGRFRGFRRGR
jgi:FkbM family methyltransferase